MATEKEVILKLKADTSGVEKGLNDVEESLKDVNKEVDKLGKAGSTDPFAKKLEELDKRLASGTMSIREMSKAVKEYQTIAVQAGQNSPVGQQAIQKAADLKDRLGDLQTQVNNLGHDGRNMQAALQLGSSVVAGYSAFQGVTALLGKENEDLAKTFVKLQAAQSVLTGIEQIRMSLEKESFLMLKAKAIQTNILTAATTVYNAVVGTSTGLLKIFRIALMSTGIGAIVVGLGLLIANFDKVTEWVKKAITYFSDLKNVMLFLLGPIGWVIMAYNALAETEDEAAKERERLHKENVSQHKERLKNIEEEKKKKIAAIDTQIKALTLEKETLEAQGKSSYEVTLQILEHEKQKLQAVLEANNAKIQSWTEYYKREMQLSGLSEEEYKKQMKGRGIDFEKLQQQAIELTESTQAEIQRADNEITKHKRSEYEKRKAEHEKQLADERKRVEDWIKLQLELEQELTNLLIANMESGAEKELAILYDKQGKERDALIAKYGENKDLLEQLEIKQNRELEDLYDKFETERLKKEQEFQDELIQLRLDNMSEGREKELESLRIKHEKELEDLRRKYGEGTELEKELMLRQKQEVADVEAEFDEQARQAKIDKAEKTLAEIQGLFDAMSEINSLINELGDQEKEKITARRDDDLSELEKNKKAALRVEGLTAKQKANIEYNFALQEYEIKKKAAEEEDKINKRQFNRDKALKLAQIGIDTASAIVKAIAMYGPPPSPLGIAGIASAGIIGGLQAAVVARTQFESGAAQISPPDFSDFAVSDTDSESDSSTSSQSGSQQNNITTQTAGLINGGGVGSTKVILSMVELNEMQNEMNQVDAVSTITNG